MQAVAAVTARLEDSDKYVRMAAVNALPHLAEWGDVQAVAAVTARLKDSDEDVRIVAVEALAQIAEWGDVQAVYAAVQREQRLAKDRECPQKRLSSETKEQHERRMARRVVK